MAKIQINNPRQTINGGAKKYYFKVKGLGGPKGDKGDKGDTGSRGPQGEPGNAATVYVGSTTTLEVGQDATVENVGTQYNAVLNFGIPQGPRGPQGIQGERGEPGQTGQTGPRGPQGEKGTNATVYIGTTTTTNPGTQARVYNSGTDSNAVLNFEIPRGDVGPQPELVQTTGTSTTKAMSQNATTVALNTGLATKQNTLTAGDNITISGSTISATDTTYTAGNGLNLNGTEFSADTTVLATQAGLTTALAPKLETEVVAELPTTGTEGKLYLTPKAHTTQTATGNPITATVTEEAGAIESFQLDGDTFQQSYTGKNLFQIPDSITVGGITLTKNQDGSFGLSGTATMVVEFAKVVPLEGSGIVVGKFTLSSNEPVTQDGISYFVHSSNSIGQWNKTLLGFFSAGTQTCAEPSTGYIKFVIRVAKGVTINLPTIQTMLEAGSTATSFEPYVGGQPSPNPDYPQQIQTVTGKQTVTVIGKNLFDKDTITSGKYISNTGALVDATSFACSDYIPVIGGEKYSYSGSTQTVASDPPKGAWYDRDKNWISKQDYAQSGTITAPANAAYYRTSIRITASSSAQPYVDTYQLELGSQATAYAPYSKQTLPLDLGSIELCKLGDYQDYIWKDGEDWKVHKATKSITASSNDFSSTSSSGGFRRATIALAGMANSGSAGRRVGSAITNLFHSSTTDGASAQFQTLANMVIYASSATQTYQELMDSIDESGMIVTYALATPTDTTITDTDLIAQLEAIRTASLENGTNTITNTATGTNLAGDMEIGYYGFAPRNRYDKWLWLDINNEYEQIGS